MCGCFFLWIISKNIKDIEANDIDDEDFVFKKWSDGIVKQKMTTGNRLWWRDARLNDILSSNKMGNTKMLNNVKITVITQP